VGVSSSLRTRLRASRYGAASPRTATPREPRPIHCRSTSIGSVLPARRAGTQLVRRAAPGSPPAVTANVTGSRGVTWNSRICAKSVNVHAPPRPSRTPAAASSNRISQSHLVVIRATESRSLESRPASSW
jgi:hypothetical protein